MMKIQQDVNYAKDDLQSTYDEYTILGMKSVRLHLFKDVTKAVKYFKGHFPCSKFIINVQHNITHQLESYQRTFNGTFKVPVPKTRDDGRRRRNARRGHTAPFRRPRVAHRRGAVPPREPAPRGGARVLRWSVSRERWRRRIRRRSRRHRQ